MKTLAANMILLGAIASQQAPAEQKIKTAMSTIYGALAPIFPLSLSQDDFQSPKNAKTISSNLKLLSKQAATLEDHGDNIKDAGFAFIGKSLATDARAAYERYQNERFDQSQFLVRNMVENCIACHSRTKSTSDSTLTAGFLKSVDTSKLDLREQALLQIATRQFEKAQKSYETFFLSPETFSGQVVFLTPMVEYLTVSIRVKRDPIHAAKHLSAILDAKQLPALVRRDMTYWIKALNEFQNFMTVRGSRLRAARQIIQQAKTLMEYPMDRSGLVHYLVSSSLLLDHLEQNIDKPADRAETYYLLGTTELLISRSYWLSQTDKYLEAAIRTAPKSKHARKAYALLEHNTYLEYSGNSGRPLPDYIKARLEALKALISLKSKKS